MPLVKPLPISWLIHDIQYEPYLTRDRLGNHVFGEPITIENVRYDESTAHTVQPATEYKLSNNGVIFIDYRNSINLPDEFVEKSRITFNGKQLILQRVITCYHPDVNVVRHYELEVV